MRNRIGVAAIALALIGISTAGAQSPTPAPVAKVGYVNTEALMAAAPGKKAADSLYAKEMADFTAQQKRWGDSLNKMMDKYRAAATKMTDVQKAAEEKRITDTQSEFDQKNQAGIQRMQNRQNELVAPLMEVVKKAIDDIRVEDGFAIIFSGDANSPIVSADKNLDLTERVVNRLKTMAAKAPASMAPAAVTKKPPTK
ncbi:MAG TPA: OmpH family outer membrane protein [Gemmatimonadaceae bacterium]